MWKFQEWKVYKDARQFRLNLHKEILFKLPHEEQFVLTSQLRRAMDSVILNIAEGSYRKSDKDFAHFLNQSLTSLYEVVSCLDLALDSKYIDSVFYHKLLAGAEALAKQINAFSRYLKRQR